MVKKTSDENKANHQGGKNLDVASNASDQI